MPSRSRNRLLARAEHVELRVGTILCEPDVRMHEVLFPTSAYISLIAPITDASLEVALVGDEGMLGVPFVYGAEFAPLRALVQGSGGAWRIEAALFRRELERNLPLRFVLNRYLDVILRQLARTAVCTYFHLVEARLARWLLMTSDRAHSERFYMTQEFMSSILGVRRTGVTAAASLLRDRKLISYARGDLIILKPLGLQAAACECYAADRETYARFLH